MTDLFFLTVYSYGKCAAFDYDLDLLYGMGDVQAGEAGAIPQDGIMSVNNDDDPNNDLSHNELNEMFCRVGRYAE